ncbi:ATP10 protein-domain-containing protein [Zopfochytrium polystomum]|nr:ATP10 protein-domain-containing protein [Zopfochytrium polystomum]
MQLFVTRATTSTLRLIGSPCPQRAGAGLRRYARSMSAGPSGSIPPSTKPQESSGSAATSNAPPSSDAPPSSFETPSPPPPPKTSYGLFERFQRKLLDEAEALVEARKNPEGENAHFLTRMEAKFQREIKELEMVEQKKLEAGQKSKLSSTAHQLHRRFEELTDFEKNEAERNRLLALSFKEGHWDEQKELARKGPKLWEAPTKMTAENFSPRLPPISGHNLLGDKVDTSSLIAGSKVSLVAFLFTAYGEPHVKSYLDPFLAEFKDVEGVRIVHFNIEETWTKAWALKLFAPLIKWRTPKELHSTYAIHCGEIRDQRKAVGMSNRLLGWVNLVDHAGRIRWQAHGPAKPHEVETLLTSTKLLLQQQQQRPASHR